MPNDVYLATISRLEPDIAMIDPGAFYASAAISLKRIADVLEKLTTETDTQWSLFNLINVLVAKEQ